MRTLLAYTFAALALFPPSGFLCIEATGDIQVEYGRPACCAEDDPAPLAFAGANDDDCVDCRDIAIPSSSLSAKRLVLSLPITLAVAGAGQDLPRDIHGVSNAALSFVSSQSHSRRLASTIIRC
jgi:hypothetical protein